MTELGEDAYDEETEKSFVGEYHAEIGQQSQLDMQHGFTSGELKLIVCTIAFGMGIDVLDVRTVILYGPPNDLLEFWQQAGRGGRDGKAARALLIDVRLNGCHLPEPQFAAMINAYRHGQSHQCFRAQILNHLWPQSTPKCDRSHCCNFCDAEN
jgi:superfamily II DNA helicase RecQ